MALRARAPAFLFPLLLVACATQGTAPPSRTTPSSAQEKAASKQEANSPSPEAVVLENPSEPSALEDAPGEPELTAETSQLRAAISAWIAAHPEAEFEEAARMANRYLRLYGYPMVLDASRLLKKNQTMIRLKAGRRSFAFHEGKELSRTPDVCGERFLKIPARLLGPDRAALVSRGREYPFSLKGFQREKFKVMKGRKLLRVIHAPEPTEPIGVSANGNAVYIKFPLVEQQVAAWWHDIGRNQPSVIDEDPYLVVRVQSGRLYFDENIEHLPVQEFEVEEEGGPNFRWRFQPSGLVLELSSHCG